MPIANCYTTDSSDPTKCEECSYNYTLNSDNTACLDEEFCTQCFNFNSVCDHSGLSKCIKCGPNAVPKTEGTSCISKEICKTCTDSQACQFNTYQNTFSCQDCSSGRVPSPDKSTCISVPTCERHQILVDNFASIVCVNCPELAVAVTGQKTCLDREFCEGCFKEGKVCDNSGKQECVSCEDKKPINKYTCQKACEIDNCGFCFDGNCLHCQEGYKLDPYGNCYPASCKSDEQCESIFTNSGCVLRQKKYDCKCNDGHRLSVIGLKCISDSICNRCSGLKQICSEKSFEMVCQDCPKGTKFYSGACVHAECENCSKTQSCILGGMTPRFKCEDCPSEYQGHNDQCYPNYCIENCADINEKFICRVVHQSFSSSFFKCDCAEGSRLSVNGECVADNCANCTGDCVEEAAGFFCICKDESYVFDGMKCVPDCMSGKFCNYHGKCQLGSDLCDCEKNYAVQGNCGGCDIGAEMVDGICVSMSCFQGNPCTQNGVCEKGICQCYQGFTGANCDECASGYIKVDGKCVSESCQAEVICSGNGACANGFCTCLEGSFGANCEQCKLGFNKVLEDGMVKCVSESTPAVVKQSSTGGILVGFFSVLILLIIIFTISIVIVYRKKHPIVKQDLGDLNGDQQYQIGTAHDIE